MLLFQKGRAVQCSSNLSSASASLPVLHFDEHLDLTNSGGREDDVKSEDCTGKTSVKNVTVNSIQHETKRWGNSNRKWKYSTTKTVHIILTTLPRCPTLTLNISSIRPTFPNRTPLIILIPTTHTTSYNHRPLIPILTAFPQNRKCTTWPLHSLSSWQDLMLLLLWIMFVSLMY